MKGKREKRKAGECWTTTRRTATANIPCRPAFTRSPVGKGGCWQVFWLVPDSGAFPFPAGKSGVLPGRLYGTYSSGDCPGIAPGSLFIHPECRTEPIAAAKVARARNTQISVTTKKPSDPCG